MVFLAVDGNSIINRAFYGIKTLTTRDGHFTNAVYGFFNIFLNLIDTYKPDACAVAFDVHQPTFRHKMYAEYKAGRRPAPPELVEQFPEIKELLDALGYARIECPGYEADDILGTLSDCGADMCYIATGDRDSLQLISDRCGVILASTKAGRPDYTLYGEEALKEKYGLTPPQMIELKALMGDSSDNIPGVKGIGEKTATDLIQRYSSIDEIYKDVDALAVSPSVKAKLAAGRDSAFFSRELGTISKQAPIDRDLTKYVKTAGDPAAAKAIMTRLELFKLMERTGVDSAQIPVTETQKAPDAKFIGSASAREISALVKAEKRLFLSLVQSGGKLIAFDISLNGAIYRVDMTADGAGDLLAGLAADESVEKYCGESKPLFAFCAEKGVRARSVVFDFALAGYLADANLKEYSLGRLCSLFRVPVPEVEGAPGLSEDERAAAAMPLLYDRMIADLDEKQQKELLTKIEIPLAEVLADMERAGFAVDAEGIARFGDFLSEELERLTAEIYEEAGHPFLISSPIQLGTVLFEEMGLPHGKKNKKGWSTNAEILSELAGAYPFVGKILEYRACAKLKSTYCDGLLKEVGDDGRIRSSFNQTETRTGRISSSEPNLQNIPVRTKLGSEMRKFFVAAPGCVLCDADYSQIELRVLADIADDKAMQQAFNDGVDIHSVTASQVFGIPLHMVSPSMRSRAKAVNFGIVYGIGSFSLAKDIGVSVGEAKRYIDSYLRHYSGVDSYMTGIIERAKRDGYVETLFHRRRYLPELASTNAVTRKFGERVARNTPIQGSAADIIKIAMINVAARLRAEKLNARLILQVHDELIVEAPVEEQEKVAALLREEMENAVKLKVGLSVDVGSGRTWYDAK